MTSLELHQGAGFLDGRVRYAWETGAYDANLKGDRLSWQGTVLSPNDTQAIFAVQFDGAGTAAQPKGQLTLDFALTGGKAGTFIGAGDATADLLGDQARIVARLPSIGALINADIATASPYDYRVNAQLDRFELARLSPFMGAIETEILGFANGTVTASGRLADNRDRVAFVNITELDAGIAGVPVSLLSPLNATLRGDDVTLKDLFVRVGSGRLSASGEWNTRLDGNFRAQFAGDFQDAVRLGKAFGVPVIVRRRRRDAVRPAQQRQPARYRRDAVDQERHVRLGRRGGRGPAAQHQRRVERRAADDRAHQRQRRDRRHRRQLLREGRGEGAAADAGRASTARSCSTRRSSPSRAFRSSSSGRRGSSSRRATSRWPTCRGWSRRTR